MSAGDVDEAAAAVERPPITPSKSVSRYRSLRGKSVSEPKKAVAHVLEDTLEFPLPLNIANNNYGGGSLRVVGNGDSSSSSAASRYRRRARSVTADKTGSAAPPPYKVPVVPTMPNMPLAPKPLNIPSKASSGSKLSSRTDTTTFIYTSDTLASIENRFPAPPTSAPPPAPPPAVATAITADTAVSSTPAESECGDQASQRQSGEENQTPALDKVETPEQKRRREREEAHQWAKEVSRLDAETDRILAEQKKRDLARLQLQLSMQSPASVRSKPRSPVLEKFSFLKIGRRSNGGTMSPGSSPLASPVHSSRQGSLEPVPSPKQFVPAPRPTGNPDERLVHVLCRQMTMELPIKLDSTAADLLVTCSGALAHPIHTDTSIAIEVYASLGLERRIRRYERAGDILASWDDAAQGSFKVLPTDAFAGDRDLELCSVSRSPEPPRGFIMHLYHAQRPGKWHKRYVTLLDTGHMYCSKRSATRPTDREAQSLCHLSDFDIYSPAEAHARKQLRPPKKFCYALRSQRPAAAFASPDGYVHYFATEDPATAHRFHALVHGWRSWYLVGKQEGTSRLEVSPAFPKKAAPQPEVLKKLPPDPPREKAHDEDELDLPPTPVSPATPLRYKSSKSVMNLIRTPTAKPQPRMTLDDTPSRIGNFEPLPDFNVSVGELTKEFDISTRRRSVRPSTSSGVVSTPGVQQQQQQQQLSSQPNSPRDQTFFPQGLLGDIYEERVQQASASPTSASKPHISSLALQTDSNPFTEGSLLHPIPTTTTTTTTDKPVEGSWLPSAVEHTARLARQREREAAAAAPPRPSTSSGLPSSSSTSASATVNGGGRHRARAGSASSRQPQQHPPMPPLLHFHTHLQASSAGSLGGHGVKPPPGTQHLVDLATSPSARGLGFLDVPPPPRSAARGGGGGGGSSSSSSSRPHTSDGSRRAMLLGGSGAGLLDRPPPVPSSMQQLPSGASQRSMASSRDGGDSVRSGGGGMRKASEPAMYSSYRAAGGRVRDGPQQQVRSRSGTVASLRH